MATSWRNSREYRVWRATVIRRDGVCKICTRGPKEGVTRHAHHIDSASYYIEERFNPDNGVCFCKDCHMNFHTNFKRRYKTKCTRYDYENFLMLTSYLREAYNIGELNG